MIFLVAVLFANTAFSSTQFNYDSGAYGPDQKPNDTRISHGWLTHSGINLFATASQAINNPAAQFIISNYPILQKGSDLPDYDERNPILGIPTNRGHFYNPITGKNIFGETSPTAMTNFIKHTGKAKKFKSEKNYNEMALELGRAIHYLSDECVPHHAANETSLTSNHIDYEHFVNNLILNVGETLHASTLLKDDPNVSYEDILNACAFKALDLIDIAMTNNSEDMTGVAKTMIPFNEQLIAEYFQKFVSDE